MVNIIDFIDSLQMSPISYLKDIKIKDLIIGHMYNICLKKLYYYDHTKDIHKRSLGYRGMGIYGYKNGSGDVYITHDIQNGKILKRKRNDTIDYFKRKPLYLHGYGEFPG